MCAQNLTSMHGIIHAGSYDTLTLNGPHKLEMGVTFRTLILRGDVSCERLTGNEIICISGHITCSGDIHVAKIQGHGSIRASKGITCELIDFSGNIFTSGSIYCERSATISGLLKNSTLIATDILHVQGVVYAQLIHAKVIDIAALDSKLFAMFAMFDYSGTSHIMTVNTAQLKATGLVSQLVHVNSAILRNHCDIEHIVYRNELDYDSSCRLLVINKDTSTGRSTRLRRA